MHGLIFKIKESHRQDQSESFVSYRNMHIQHTHTHRKKYVCMCTCTCFFRFTTSQMKSLHYDQCLFLYVCVYICRIYIYTYTFVVSSRRNKTNPHHRNKFIPVLHATHLQAFKPKLSTYDQSLKTDQQDVSF